MCTSVNQRDMATMHHELGHVQVTVDRFMLGQHYFESEVD